MTDGPIETPGPNGTEDLSGPQEVIPQENSGGHPAWQPILDALPDDALRNMVMPHLQEWDRGVQERFQSLHSTYEPWKDIIDQAEPSVVQQALGLIAKLEEDPEYVYNTIAQAYGLGQGTTEAQPGAGAAPAAPQPVSFEGTEYDPNDPLVKKIGELEGVLGGLQQFLQTQQQQEEEKARIAAYDAHMATLKQKYNGPWDEDVIDALVANGVDPEQAVQRYQNSVRQAAQQQLTPTTTAPPVMGGAAGGSGLPSDRIDPGKLSSDDTKKLVHAIIQREMGGGGN
ncbi:MAG TPA: hypothetical protein VFK94_02225 [Patescibacteria group bacterium]|nr:hypothetical protein [Patescibacteria group bacterium]